MIPSIRQLLNKVTKALGITALDQWYYISHHAASKVIGSRALNKFGGTLSGFLKYAYPNHQFNEEKLASTRNLEKDQKFIEVSIRKLFPNTEIHTKARKSVGIINPETDEYLEIDFWIPSLKLGIEYQDKHHYQYQWYANEALEEYQKRDHIKKYAMSKMGYTLITIGYWWDKSIESIAATIRKVRPDLLQEYAHSPASPIATEPPVAVSPVIPGVVGLMSPFVPKHNFDPTNWYGGEKHDGIRGVYNPNFNKMFSRSGNELSIIPALLKDIPNTLVEGEILAGRGNYNSTTALSNHTYYAKVKWQSFRYVVFDIPDAELGNYRQRYSLVMKSLLDHPFIFAQAACQVLLISKNHLKMLLDAIIGDGGEGVIARRDSRYEYGRAQGLAKLKVRRDADAQVLRVNERSCTCKLVSGATADILFSADFNPSNLTEGDIVSYYHNGYSLHGLPKRGEIYKTRYDVSWDHLTRDEAQNTPYRKSHKEVIGSNSLVTRNKARVKKGYWNKPSNVRAFFDRFAQAAGFDPLIPENWYSVRYSSLERAGGSVLLTVYTNVKNALSRGYPELTFDEEKFRPRVRAGHWNELSNVRMFFEGFAQTTGFDPLVPANWYSVTYKAVQRAGGGGILNHFGLTKALAGAYPELRFEAERFRVELRVKNKKGHWNNLSNVRAFFDEFARASGFNPLIPEKWFTATYKNVQQAGGGQLLKNFGLVNALKLAYPEVKFKSNV